MTRLPTHPPANPASEVAEALPTWVRAFLCSSSDLPETFADGDGPEATAQRAERHGVASISAWKGHWQVTLTELGLAVREYLLTTQEETSDG